MARISAFSLGARGPRGRQTQNLQTVISCRSMILAAQHGNTNSDGIPATSLPLVKHSFTQNRQQLGLEITRVSNLARDCIRTDMYRGSKASTSYGGTHPWFLRLRITLNRTFSICTAGRTAQRVGHGSLSHNAHNGMWLCYLSLGPHCSADTHSTAFFVLLCCLLWTEFGFSAYPRRELWRRW